MIGSSVPLPDPPAAPLLSFIVPAHDEEELIGATLAALFDAGRALGEPFELVVVDDASTDRTAEIAAAAGARVVRADVRQIAAARNAGAAAARGDRFVFVDADTIVGADVVRAAVDALAADAVGGGAMVRFDEPIPRWARLLLPVARLGYRVMRLASGCFLFCRRDAFEAVGGFDAALFAGEEGAMSRALGRHGRVAVLRERVLTSGRKLRTHAAREIFGTVFRLALGGRRMQRREKLPLWYGPRGTD